MIHEGEAAYRCMASALIQWAAREGRKTPWRSMDGVYALAVAEILLQKTKGSDAEPVWRAVLDSYPDAQALAAAPNSAVHALVSKLGLGTQRVQRLKAMAGALLDGGSQQKIPGLGPYGTAIVALAVGREPGTAPVDGNVARVICRVFDLSFERGEPRKKPDVKEAVRHLLATQTTPALKLQLAYALVDLGSIVCTPRHPACPACPALPWCRVGSRREGLNAVKLA